MRRRRRICWRHHERRHRRLKDRRRPYCGSDTLTEAQSIARRRDPKLHRRRHRLSTKHNPKTYVPSLQREQGNLRRGSHPSLPPLPARTPRSDRAICVRVCGRAHGLLREQRHRLAPHSLGRSTPIPRSLVWPRMLGHAVALTRGSVTTNVDPTPTWLESSMVPPPRSTAWRTRARPRPVPPEARERAVSTR